MKKIQNPHDKYVKFNLSVKDNIIELCKNCIPEKLFNLADFSTLKINKESFIDERLKEYFSDILYTVNIADSKTYIYILLEHKSYDDSLAMMQILQYIIKVWELHIKQNKIQHSIKKLPIVLPILLYHGQGKWNSGKQLIDNMYGPVQDFFQFIPNFEIILFDLSDYSDNELKGKAAFRVFLMIIKHIFDDDFPIKFEKILRLFSEVMESETGMKSFIPLIKYVFSTRDDLSITTIADMVSKHISEAKGGEVMTLAEKLRKEGELKGELKGRLEGRLEGKLEGKLEHARNVLIILAQEKFGFLNQVLINDLKTISSLEILDMLFLKTLSCESLDEFMNMVNKARC